MTTNAFAVSDDDVRRFLEGRLHDPFAILGRRDSDGKATIRAFIPRCQAVFVENRNQPAERIPGTDFFEFTGSSKKLPQHYRFLIDDEQGNTRESVDPYSYGPIIDDAELHAFNNGLHRAAEQCLGANPRTIDGVAGTLFAVWAPNAERVSIVGEFNHWDGRCHTMRIRGASGVWELFVPGVGHGPYKFELRQRESGSVVLKADPYAQFSELRPSTASLVTGPTGYTWQDEEWQQSRRVRDWRAAPMSIYEVHLGSWNRNDDGSFMNYRVQAERLCDYVKKLGFTHIELMPISEHPLDESWGYQTTGYFSPTSRYGTPDDLRWFVDHFHQNGIGVLLDWVPAHFPRDAYSLANFDGTSLYEYHDPRKAEHRDWGTLIFNYERDEVRSFLISSALYWLREFHFDGLRVDAVASMLYLNFSRQAENWVPNKYGGHQNLEAIDFICDLNNAVREDFPGCVMIAEESTDWHGVTESTSAGGLGFHMKWNMGWMHDTLNYLAKDPIHRKHHQDWLTFGPTYVFDEKFMLPLSHDEVVHLKRSLLGKMPGDEWQQLANLRLLYTYQWCFPGKELLFMGGEFGQTTEWDAGAQIQWQRLQDPGPRGISALLTDLNGLLATMPALSAWDFDRRGFEWIDGDDRERSVIAFMRHAPQQSLIIVMNFTPVVHYGYRIGVPTPGRYREVLNSDNDRYGGGDVRNPEHIFSEPVGHHGRGQSLRLTLPPLGGVILMRDEEEG